MGKPWIASRVVACLLVAAAGGWSAALRADATTIQPIETGVTQWTQLPMPPKFVARRMYERFAGQLLCRDSRKLRMGLASWYAGSRTASGEIFRADDLTAASRSLPFDTRIRVTNLRNGRSIVVRINDRGPYVRGRILDLTPRAAAKLDMQMHGTAPVYIEIVQRETKSAAAEPFEYDRR